MGASLDPCERVGSNTDSSGGAGPVRPGLARAAGSIGAWTLLSRVLGLVRDVLMLRLLGAQWALGTFVLAWLVPNMLRRLFGEGALSAAFVPAFTKTLERDGRIRARAMLGGVTGALVAALGIVTVAVVAFALTAPDRWFYVEEPRAADLLRQLVVILFPYVVPICLVAIYSGALNAFGVFAPGAAAPVVLNLFWIGGLCAALALGIEDPAELCRLLAFCLLGAGLAQLLLVAWPLYRRDGLARPRVPRATDGSREVFVRLAPTVIGMSLVQVNLLLDQGLAYYLLGEGVNTHVYLANRLLLFPHALIAIPLATAVFPTLASHVSRDDSAAMRRSLERALSMTLFLAIPATLGLIVVLTPFVDVVFVQGQYRASDAVDTAWTTTALVASLPALGLAQLYARALYALGDTGTPARLAGWLVVLNLTLNLVFVLGLGLGVAGLTTATSCCAYINALALHAALARRHHVTVELPWRSIGTTLGASVLMTVAVVAARQLLPTGERAKQAIFQLAIPVAVGVLVFGSIQLAAKSPELTELAIRIRAWRHSRRANSR